MSTDPPAPHTDPGLVESLRTDLGGAGLSVGGMEELLGPVAAQALHRDEVLPALRSLAARADGGRDPLATLVRLFVLGRPVLREDLGRALPAVGTDGAARLGLVAVAGQDAHDEVRPLVDLRPYASADAAGEVEWWLASDLGEAVTGTALRRDHVLASAVPRRRSRRPRSAPRSAGCWTSGRAAGSRRCTRAGTAGPSWRPTSRPAPWRSPGSTRLSRGSTST